LLAPQSRGIVRLLQLIGALVDLEVYS
jgi:hypothetical protein